MTQRGSMRLAAALRMPQLLHARPVRSVPIGHRGAPREHAENTLDAFASAVQLGCWMVELDVRQCKDGTLVVYHDDDLERLCAARGTVEASTFDALARERVDGWYRIPRLGEVLRALREKVWVNVEIKTGDPARVAGEIGACGMADQVVVTSFDWELVTGFARAAPEMARGLISEEDGRGAPEALARHGAIGWFPAHATVTQDLIEAVHGAGASVVPWTVDDPADLDRLAGWGVDGIISNDVTTLVRVVS